MFFLDYSIGVNEMRFRKSVKICPGVKVNFSKSGVSTSIGTKGASVTIGKNGTYANVGIPGTGIYERRKISGFSDATRGNSAGQARFTGGKVSVEYEGDGTVRFFDGGKEITDTTIIRTIKKDPAFKRDLAKANATRIETYSKETAEFTEIQKKSKKVYKDVESLCRLLKCNQYQIRPFGEILPTDEELRAKASAELGHRLFGNKKRYNEYVHNYKIDYEQRRKNFEKLEKEKKDKLDKQYREELEIEKNRLRALSEASPEEIDNEIHKRLRSIEFPFEFNVQYEIRDGKIFVDLDLPEIEDIPTKTTRTMKSGIVKVVDKTKKEIKENYSDCVYGLTIYFASEFFNIALSYNEVILSAYTQRRNNKGIIQDDYILSVKFDRDGFSRLSYHVDAKKNCMKFDNICLQNTDMSFKKITPFE